MDTHDNTFVVGIDFWGPSENAMAMAVRFAQLLDARLIALHVIEKKAHYPEKLNVDPDEPEEALMLALKNLIKPFRSKGVKIEPLLITGNVTHSLLEVCKTYNSDLIFLGIREGRLLEDIFIGTNTMHLVRSEEYPLVVVDLPPKETPMKELMIPFDAEVGIEGILQFLNKLKQPLTERALLISTITPEDNASMIEDALDKAAEALLATGIKHVEIEIVQGTNAHNAMINQVLADRALFDIVLLEHIDYSESGQMTAGSLIEEIVTKCRMPVLTIPKSKSN